MPASLLAPPAVPASSAAYDRSPSVRVSTWLTLRERYQVDAASDGHFCAVHRDGLAAVCADLAHGHADAALVSVALISADHEPVLAAVVRALPGCAIAGLVAEVHDRELMDGAHILGRAGVRLLLDGRAQHGWSALRRVFDTDQLPDQFLRQAVGRVLAAIAGAYPAGMIQPLGPLGCTEGLARFFGAVFSPRLWTVRRLAAELGLRPSTFQSRFLRAGLPSPRQYLVHARLAWAAHLGESRALSLGNIADRVGMDSSQGFTRTVQRLMGLTGSEFRARYTGTTMLDRYCATLIAPFRERLCTFDPLAPTGFEGVYPTRLDPQSATGGAGHPSGRPGGRVA